MTIRAYRTQPFETTHENRVFDTLLKELQRAWGNSEEIVLLLGNFHCVGSEIDAAVVKRDSITVIDFKNYGGAVSFSENGRWRAKDVAQDVEIKGGRKPNPYLQIRDNKFALLNVLKDFGTWPSGKPPDFGHISGMVVFHRPIDFDDRQLPPKIASWFHVVDFDHVVERLAQITSRAIHLSNRDLEAVTTKLGIPSYTPVGAHMNAAIAVEVVGVDDESVGSGLPGKIRGSSTKEVRMPRERRLEEAHFVCRQGRNVVDQNDGTFLTSYWVMRPEHIQPGLVFALHEKKAESSYLQGLVLSLTDVRTERTSSGMLRRRVKLLVQKTPESLPWKGRGSGEKGFVWR